MNAVVISVDYTPVMISDYDHLQQACDDIMRKTGWSYKELCKHTKVKVLQYYGEDTNSN